MSIREEIVKALVEADEQRIAARAMEGGPERERRWQVAVDRFLELEGRASEEELAAARAIISHRDREGR